MKTQQVEAVLKDIEEKLYDIERKRTYIIRLNDFDSDYELDTLDGHRIHVAVTHSKLEDGMMMAYEISESLIDCPECHRKWQKTERVVDATIGRITWHLHCVCGYSTREVTKV